MVEIRTATEADIPLIGDLGRMMHFESRYAKFDFNPGKWERLLRVVIPQGLTFVAEDSKGAVGVFVGIMAEHFFGDDLTSHDLITYVLPESRGRVGVLLTKEYIRRAKALGVRDIHIGISTGLQPDRVGRFYEKLGFSHIGGGYAMEV